MKQLIIFLGIALVAFTPPGANNTLKVYTENINLSSSLTMESAVVVQNGCTADLTTTIKITNPAESAADAEFLLTFYMGTTPVIFKVTEIDGQPAVNTNSRQYFKTSPGTSKTVKVQFSVGGNKFMFNKSYLFKAVIIPKRYSGLNFSFFDSDQSNDLLSKEVFIGSPNALCFKCIETEQFEERTDFSFYIPGVDFGTIDCQKFRAFVSGLQPSLKRPVLRTDEAKAFFKFIPNGVIENTSVKRVLIKNKDGKYLTFNNNVPKYMDRIVNDMHHYQDWVILKGIPAAKRCSEDKVYKLVQYIDNNKCYELYQLKVNGVYNLFYRTGIHQENIGDRILIAPRYTIAGEENGN